MKSRKSPCPGATRRGVAPTPEGGGGLILFSGPKVPFFPHPPTKAHPLPFSAIVTLLNMTSSIPAGERLFIPARIPRFWELLPPGSGG
jgi:hypothetical protein